MVKDSSGWQDISIEELVNHIHIGEGDKKLKGSKHISFAHPYVSSFCSLCDAQL